MHRSRSPLPPKVITMRPVLIFIHSLSYSRTPAEPSTVTQRFPTVSISGAKPISICGARAFSLAICFTSIIFIRERS